MASAALTVALLDVAPARATTVTNNLVAYLKFDGNLNDSTTNAVNGTAVGTPTIDAGFLGQALHVLTVKDGSVFNYVTLGYPSVLQFGSDDTGDTTDFSLAFWVKINSQSDDIPFIGNKDWNSGGNLGWVVDTEGNGMKWNYRDDDGSGRRDSPHVAPQLEDKNWHHIATTFVRTSSGHTNDPAKIYVDGVLVDTTSIAPDAGLLEGSVDTLGNSLNVNVGQDGTGTYTDGGSAGGDMLIDDLGIWRRALTSDEVTEIYNKGLLGKSLDQDVTIIPVTITTQPMSQTVIAGLKASFGVAAGGLNLKYQWKLGTQVITNATNATFVIPQVSTSDAGDYTVVVKGTGSSATSAAAKLTVRTLPEPLDLTPGLVAHLKFDGDYTDASGKGVNGTAQGTANQPAFETGFLGKAVHITNKKDGSLDAYVTLGYPDALKFGDEVTGTDFSVSFWVKQIEQNDDQAYIANKNWGSSDNAGWGIFSQGGGLYRTQITGTDKTTKFSTKPPGATLNDAAWHLLTTSVHRTGTVDSYIDGNLASSVAIATTGSIDTDDQGYAFNLGQDGTGAYTDGGSAEIDFLMDDLGIWHRALTGDEAAAIYLRGVAGKTLDQVPTTGPTVNPNPAIPGLSGGAFTDVQVDTANKTISAKLPADGSQGFFTITPPVTIKTVTIVSGRLIITY